jgi:hypothetical protein
MTTIPGISDDDGMQLISETLRMFVGQGRRFTWDDVAAATGDDVRKLRSYVEKDGPRMPAPVMMRVFAVLPPEAWGRINRRMGYMPPAPADTTADAATARAALTATSRFVAEASEALEDGELTHIERTQLARRAEQIIPTLHIIADAGS